MPVTLVEALKAVAGEAALSTYPTMEDVQDAIKQDDVIQIVRWHQHLRMAESMEEIKILYAIIDQYTNLKKRQAA